MKKILFSLMALVCSMSMNAQVMKVMKGNTVVAEFPVAQADNVVFEEIPFGTVYAQRTGGSYVKCVQLWEDGPKFAEYNVGVTDGKAESFGGYYAWGGNQDKVDDHNTGNANLTGDNDTATKLWGSAWRMPTRAELDDLLANCNVEWTTVNDVTGNRFTGKVAPYNSNSIFLPAARRFTGSDDGQGEFFYIWSSTPEDSSKAFCLYCDFQGTVDEVDGRELGYLLSVRAVLAE